MRPRPRSRKHALTVVEADALTARILEVRAQGGEPAAILAGKREWQAVRNQRDARKHIEWWPGDDETFDRVPVLIRMGAGEPTVMASQQELEDAMLGSPE